MDEEKTLEKLGLNKNEAKIYYKLLILKEATAVKIAKETGLFRQTVYDTLEKLSKKGLVSITKKEYINHYSAIEPKALERMLEEKKDALKLVMPNLISLYQEDKEDVKIDIFKKIEGVNTVIKGIIEQEDEVLMIGGGTSSWEFVKRIKPKLFREFQKVKWRMIQVKSKETDELLKIMKTGEVRFLPQKYKSNMAIMSYGNRAGLFIVGTDITFIRIIGAAKTFKNYFDIMWEVAEK
jgi:sugar-specific transcriptional regulator TrmB